MKNENHLMPVFFFGHGSPMNAIEENEFTTGWRNAVKSISTPVAVLCISAHWETKGTQVTAMGKPATIHDFGGFPRELYEVQYPAPGSPETAELIKEILSNTEVSLDHSWGLDHGCWSVVKHLFPKAEVPVLQLSLDYFKRPADHVKIASQLNLLREKGILIIGSGNMIHNLRAVDWNKPVGGFDWAVKANEKLKRLIADNDIKSLSDYKSLGGEVALSVPTPEHFLPVLYALALKRQSEEVTFFNDRLIMGSLSMTSFSIS